MKYVSFAQNFPQGSYNSLALEHINSFFYMQLLNNIYSFCVQQRTKRTITLIATRQNFCYIDVEKSKDSYIANLQCTKKQNSHQQQIKKELETSE